MVISIKTLKVPYNKSVKKTYKKYIKRYIRRANNIIFYCSYFIRAFVLYKFSVNEELPKLNKDIILMCFRAITKKSSGPTQKRNIELMNQLNVFYDKHFINMLYPNTIIDKNNTDKYKFDASNLSYILACAATEMSVSYVNNIKLNFCKYLCQYVNQSFKDDFDAQLNECTKKIKELKELLKKSDTNKVQVKEQLKEFSRDKLKKQLKRESMQIKNDLVMNTLKSPSKYHKWITDIRKIILPPITINNTHKSLSKGYPYKYLKYMLIMNSHLEQAGFKLFQPISLRTDIKNKYVIISTAALIDMLPIKDKNNYLANIRKTQHALWNRVLKTYDKYKINGYTFNHQISTDGYTISLSFIKNSDIAIQNKKYDNKLAASKKKKKYNKGISRKEVKQNEDALEDTNKQAKQEELKKFKEKKKLEREEFKKLPPDKQLRKKLEAKMEREEFNYIGDLIKCKSFLEDFKKAHIDNNIVCVDPGKRSILMMLGSDNQVLNYTNRNRLKETKRLKYVKLIDNRKKSVTTNIKKNKNWSIKKIESDLAKFKCKTVSLIEFKKYAQAKFKLKKFIDEHKEGKKYNKYLQKLQWFAYLNKRRHEDNLLDRIEKMYGKDAILIIGDWGNKGRLSFISTPCVGIKRKLEERFKVYHIDEYNTSKLHHKTENECKKLQINFNGKQRELHSILTYQMSNGRLGCINRDINAVKNMHKIVVSLLNEEGRPENYCRNKLKPV